MSFTARLEGDLTPLLAAEYQAFFGDDARLAVIGLRDPEGTLELSSLVIAADALQLSGNAVIAPGGWPERVNLTGRVVSPDGGPVRLPIGGVVPVELRQHPNAGDAWQADSPGAGDLVYNTACELLFADACPYRRALGPEDPGAGLPQRP